MSEERRKGERRLGQPVPAVIPTTDRQPSARVYIHPRCWDGPAFGAFAASLEAHGFDLAKVKIGPLGTRKRRELVRELSSAGAYTRYERMDGTQFQHRMGEPAPEPEFA